MLCDIGFRRITGLIKFEENSQILIGAIKLIEMIGPVFLLLDTFQDFLGLFRTFPKTGGMSQKFFLTN
jgi:hypothetical protein